LSPLRKLAVQFSHFFLGTLSMQLIGLVSFPILTRVLTKEQYGILGLVTITMLVAVAIAKAGLADGVIRFYRECADSPERLTEFASTVLFRGLIFAAGATIVYFIAFPSLEKALGIKEQYQASFMIMGGYVLIRPINILVMYFLRVNDRTIFLNAIYLVERAVSVSLGLFLLLFLIHDLSGYFLGIISAEVIIAVILYRWFFKKYTLTFRKASSQLNLKLLRFGIPLLFSELSYLFMTYADRYLMMGFFDEAMLGLYSVGYNLAMYIGNIIMISLSYAVVPIYVDIYEKEGKERTEEFLGKVLHYFIMATILMFFGYWAVSREVFITLATEKYSEAASFSPIILAGTSIYALSSILNAGLYLRKKTPIMLLIMVSAVGLNIGMNYFLMPRYGVFGGAWTAFATSSIVVLLTGIFSSRYIAIRAEISQIIYYFSLSIGMFLAMNYLHLQNTAATLALKLSVGGLIAGLGILYRERELMRKLMGWLSMGGKGRWFDPRRATIRGR
jgi:O-antigen/teichoic acid export membrane protein